MKNNLTIGYPAEVYQWLIWISWRYSEVLFKSDYPRE